jgi:hypothetical protein
LVLVLVPDWWAGCSRAVVLEYMGALNEEPEEPEWGAWPMGPFLRKFLPDMVFSVFGVGVI